MAGIGATGALGVVTGGLIGESLSTRTAEVTGGVGISTDGLYHGPAPASSGLPLGVTTDLNETTTDGNGHPHLNDSTILFAEFYDISKDPFGNPDDAFTGWAADGNYYKSGVRDFGGRARASWADEPESDDRGPQTGFPERILILGTQEELVILDADTRDVFIRFTKSRVVQTPRSWFGGPYVVPKKVAFSHGKLLLLTGTAILLADFQTDQAYWLDDTSYVSGRPLSERNENDYFDFSISFGFSLQGSAQIDLSLTYIQRYLGTGQTLVPMVIVGEAGTVDYALLYVSETANTYSRTSVPVVHSSTDLNATDGSRTYTVVEDVAGESGSNTALVSSDPRSFLSPGDYIQLGSDVFRLTRVTETSIGFTPKASVGLVQGPSTNYYSQVHAVRIRNDGTLVWASRDFVGYIPSLEWLDLGVSTSPANRGKLSYPAAHVTGIREDDGVVYVLSDSGVFETTLDFVVEGREVLLAYAPSSSAGLDAAPLYAVLQASTSEILDLAIDPVTGNILVASGDGTVEEVDTSLAQSFRVSGYPGSGSSVVFFRDSTAAANEWLVAGVYGADIESVTVNRVDYDPVFDYTPESEFVLQLLNSFYREMLDDTRMLTVLWSAAVQGVAAEILYGWHLQKAQSIRTVPVITQRKWMYIDVNQAPSFEQDPGFQTAGIQDQFVYDKVADVYASNWVVRNTPDRVYRTLRSEVTQGAGLYWSSGVKVESADTRSMALFGYFNTDTLSEVNDVVSVGVFQNPDTGALNPVIVYSDSVSTGDSYGAEYYVSKGRYAMSLDRAYRLEGRYYPLERVITLGVVDLEAVLVDSATGYTEDGGLGKSSTNLLRDDSADWSSVSVGDVVEYGGSRYEIVAIVDGIIQIVSGGLPVSREGLAYTIRGASEVSSLSLKLSPLRFGSEALFTVNAFGSFGVDLRGANSSVFAQKSSAGKSMRGTTWGWVYTDPSFGVDFLSVPRLQERPTDPEEVLYESYDYRVNGSVVEFFTPPERSWWAEYAGIDEHLIRDSYGVLVGLEADSSDFYRSQVQGLFRSFFRGPTISSLRVGAHLLVGLPVAVEPGTVESVNPDFSGKFGQVTISGRGYLWPIGFTLAVEVGDSVVAYQPLVDGVEVSDYVKDPDWFVGTGLHELEKYSTFLAEINIDALDLNEVTDVVEFLEEADSVRTKPYLRARKDLSDSLRTEDSFILELEQRVSDTLCGIPRPAYDAGYAYDFPGEAWGSLGDGFEGLVVEENGSAVEVGAGSSLTADVSWTLAGLTTDGVKYNIYVGLSETFSGAAGAAEAGSYFLNTNTGNGRVSVGALVTCSAFPAGTVVVAVSGVSPLVEVSQAATTDGTGLVWSIQNQTLDHWVRISERVSSTEILTFTENAPLVGRRYKAYLLASEYLEPIRYDEGQELCPDEQLAMEWCLKPTYNTTEAVGVVDWSAGVDVVLGGTTGMFTPLVGLIGSPGVAVVDPGGRWYEVLSAYTLDTNVTLSGNGQGTYSGAIIGWRPLIIDGSSTKVHATFENGSATVIAVTGDFSTAGITAGEWIQPLVVPAGTEGSYPAAQVLSVDSAGQMTLTAPYEGADAADVRLIQRAVTADNALPVVLEVPDGKYTTTTLTYTAFDQCKSVSLQEELLPIPLSMPGLILFLDSEWGVGKESASADLVAGEAWLDRSPAANHYDHVPFANVAWYADADRPGGVSLAGRAAISVGFVSGIFGVPLADAGDFLFDNEDFHIWVVADFTDVSTYATPFYAGNTDFIVLSYGVAGTSVQLSTRGISGGTTAASADAGALGGAVIRGSFESAGLGSFIQTVDINGGAATGSATVTGSADFTGLDGDVESSLDSGTLYMYSLVVVRGKLSASAKQAITNYLMARYGL